MGPRFEPSEQKRIAAAARRSRRRHGGPEPTNSMKATRRDVLALAAGAAAFGAWPAGAQTGGEPDELGAASNSADFDQVWELVRDRFYDPSLHGLDWQEAKARYRPQAIARARARRRRSRSMRCWGSSAPPTRITIRPEDPAYYQLADIFVGALEHRGLDRVFPKGEVAYPGIGAFTEADGQGRIFVTGVIDGAPAHQAGVLVGDEILSADDRPFRAGRLLSRQGRGRPSRFRSAARRARRRSRSA